MATQTLSLNKPSKNSDLLLATVVISILMVMVVPLPEILLDFLLAISITLGILILFIALFSKRSLRFFFFSYSVTDFYTFRLSLNVASTRLILLNANSVPVLPEPLLNPLVSLWWEESDCGNHHFLNPCLD